MLVEPRFGWINCSGLLLANLKPSGPKLRLKSISRLCRRGNPAVEMRIWTSSTAVTWIRWMDPFHEPKTIQRIVSKWRNWSEKKKKSFTCWKLPRWWETRKKCFSVFISCPTIFTIVFPCRSLKESVDETLFRHATPRRATRAIISHYFNADDHHLQFDVEMSAVRRDATGTATVDGWRATGGQETRRREATGAVTAQAPLQEGCSHPTTPRYSSSTPSFFFFFFFFNKKYWYITFSFETLINGSRMRMNGWTTSPRFTTWYNK